MRARVLVALVAAAGGFFAGCRSVSPRPDIEGLRYGVQAYDDLPVPQDFTFDSSDESWAYRRYEKSIVNLRCGRFRYVGDRDVGQVINWYNEQMPKQGWKQKSLNRDSSGTKAILVFTKGPQQAEEAAKVEVRRIYGPSKPLPYTELLLSVGVASALQ